MKRTTITPRHPTAAAIERLAKMFGLPSAGQDWEIVCADADRVCEFLDAYESAPLNQDEKFTLMALIVASYDELLTKGCDDPRHWDRIRRHLLDRFDLHGYTVQYWSLPEEDEPNDVFDFTWRAREIMTAVYGSRQKWPRRPAVIKRFIDRPVPAVPGVPLDAMDITDNRDGTGFTLWWSKFRNRSTGERLCGSVEEAMEHAAREFGVPVERWQDV